MSQNIEQILSDLKSALQTGTPGGAGITDSASRQQVAINDNGVVMTKLRVDSILGDLSVEKRIASAELATGNVTATNIVASGSITAETLHVKRIVSEQSQDNFSKSVTFQGSSIRDLDGKGLLWAEPDFTHQFIYKADAQRIFSTENIDLYRGKAYQINGVNVIEEGRLSDSVTTSNLTKVGTLNNLRVDGNIQAGQTMYINDMYSRVSINTEEMLSALTIQDGGATLVFGGDEATGSGRIGTWGPNALRLITDNTDRVIIQGNNVYFGNLKAKNSEVAIFGTLSVSSDVRVEGTLHVNKLVADTRVERDSSLTFQSNSTESIYGKGLLWKGEGHTKSFYLGTNIDRFISTENIDLSDNRAYYIGASKVLDANGLGDGIKNSSLTRVGVLENLEVNGTFRVREYLELSGNTVTVTRPLSIQDLTGNLTFNANQLATTSKDFTLVADGEKIISKDNLGNLALGDKDRTDRVISAYGKLSVNVTNPDPEAELQVDGMVMFGGKKFINAARTPDAGVWTKGDITWNSQPEDTGFIGWVCITGGKPGVWKPFGYIGK